MKEITVERIISLAAHLEQGKSACLHDLDVAKALRWCVAEIERRQQCSDHNKGVALTFVDLVEKHCRKSA